LPGLVPGRSEPGKGKVMVVVGAELSWRDYLRDTGEVTCVV
jgi:hypothetical protein